jgi:O-antigen/teichoic acid export membrane protein
MFKKLASLRGKTIRIAGDFVLNIIASAVYTFARQLVVFPLLAARMSDADYGTLLTVSGLVNIATAIVGVTLNNVRLIQNSLYQERNLKGDFHWLCAVGSAVSVLFVVIVGRMFELAVLTTVLLGIYVCVDNLYQYALAHFRLNLNFKRNLIVNCLVSI